ncbi:MAG TPA: GAF domain-containing protein [Candidatus Hydrogenedentes bacterium]|nr:GAF domain-containing protein [Candidatus Hydrogenedentota bacterium]
MDERISTVLLVLSAVWFSVLGAVVIVKNPHKRTHRAFALLAFTVALWTSGIACIIHSHDANVAVFWLRVTFVPASFIPLLFHIFMGLFPRQRYEGVKPVLWFLCGVSPVLALLGVLTPLYVRHVEVFPDRRPIVEYGPVFYVFACCVAITIVFSYQRLFIRLRTAQGVERRQIQHVILGIAISTTCITLTNIVAPIIVPGVAYEVYGPMFLMFLAGVFAYSMIRFHLLDVWVMVSRTTVYAVLTAFIVLTFFSSISIVHLAFSGTERIGRTLPTVLAALVIALVLQPLKERVQLVLDRTILKRRYDTSRFLARITQKASQIVQFNQLLEQLAQDIRETLGVTTFRVLLIDENDDSKLITEYSTDPDEVGGSTRKHEALIEYMDAQAKPILLEELLHTRPTQERVTIANHLAELEAYCCLPLKTRSNLVGILTLGQKSSKDMYSAADLMVFSAVAGPLGTAIENARLYHALEQVNMHMASILKNMRGGVIAVDTEGKVRTVNEGAAALLGPVQFGQDLGSLPRPIAEALRQSLDEQPGSTDFETLIPGPGNVKTPVLLSSSCLTTAAGEHTGAMAMIYDLTQIKRLEQNVRRAARLSSIGTLAAGMAHEIKNPLVSIKTFTQLLPSRYNDEEFRTTFCDVVPHEVERINAIVTRLLDFARPKPMEFTKQDLRSTVGHVLALVENQTTKAHIVVEVNFPPGPLEVHGNEQQLHQVFLNLILNAIEAMADAGEGTLRVTATRTRRHLRRDGVSPYFETECAQVVVADTGVGIPAPDQEQIFTPFFTTKGQGCGLGLAVVHGIVVEHGGEIDLTSSPANGAAFTVTLPLAERTAALQKN